MILITGAGGNVGREVLNQIALTNRSVRAAYQSASRTAQAPAGVETVVLDYNRPETMRAALEDVDRVFLVGPVAANLVDLERKATDEINRSAVRQIVKLSALGSTHSIFPRQHTQSEDYIKSSGAAYTFLRPNGFMQNLVMYSAPTIRSQSVFFGSQGEGQVSYVDLRDVAAFAVKVLTEDGHLGQAYALTGPEALTAAQTAQMLSTAVGREIKYVDLPADQLKNALLSAGVPEFIAEGDTDLNQLYRKGGASAVSNDIERILGRPPIRFGQFARDYADAFAATESSTS